jgi:hypothetical protein
MALAPSLQERSGRSRAEEAARYADPCFRTTGDKAGEPMLQEDVTQSAATRDGLTLSVGWASAACYPLLLVVYVASHLGAAPSAEGARPPRSAMTTGGSSERPATEPEYAGASRKEAFHDFEDRVERYLKIHAAAVKQLGPFPRRTTPAHAVAYSASLADRIRALRPGAKQGDISKPASEPLLEKIIAAELARSGQRPTRRAARAGNPPIQPEPAGRMDIDVAVNATYPQAAAVSTVPPHLLLRLPRLPRPVEYRFVGRSLILRDVAANRIVDFIPEAAPPLSVSR